MLLGVEDVGLHHRGAYILVSPSVKVAAGGAGGRAPDLRGPESFGDEMDHPLLGLEGSGDALGGPGLLATDNEADVAPAGATRRR